MAVMTQKTRVVGNTGRVFGSSRKAKKSKSGGTRRRQNLGEIIGFTLGNPGRKVGSMATKKKSQRKSSHRPKGYGLSKYKSNPGRRRRRQHNPGMHMTRYKRRHNVGGAGGLGPLVTNAVFVIIGALGSKLGAQAVLGANNVGLIGYAANAAAGGALWFLTEKVMHNRAAASGVIAGTLVQIILRIINDYTPFGSYVANLGMGDYQMQSFVTPQVLVDPWNSAEIQIPDGWGAAPPPMLAPASANAGGGNAMGKMTAAAGVPSSTSGGGGLSGGGLYSGGGGGGLYSL
jgi:hypothetical protein